MDPISSDIRALVLQPHPDRVNIGPHEELEKIFQEAKMGVDGEYLFHQNQALLLLRLEPRAAVQVFSLYTPLTHFVRAKAELTVIQEVAQMFKDNISEYKGTTDFTADRKELHNALHEVSRIGGSEVVAKYLFREFPEMILGGGIELLVEKLLKSKARPLVEKLRLLDFIFELQPCLLSDPKKNNRLFGAALENRYGSFMKAVLFSKLAQAKPTSFTLCVFKEMGPEDISFLVPILPHLKYFNCLFAEWTKEGYTDLMNSLHLMGSEIQSLKIPYLVGSMPNDECTGQTLFDAFMENNSSLQSLTLTLQRHSDEMDDDSLLEKAYKNISLAVKNHTTINTLELTCFDRRLLPMSGASLADFLMNTNLQGITFHQFNFSSEDWPEDSKLSANQFTKIEFNSLCHFASEILEHLLAYLGNKSPKLKQFCTGHAGLNDIADQEIDITAALCDLLNTGSLEEFEFRAERRCKVDMQVLVPSLATNTSLTGFYLGVDGEIYTASDGVMAMRKLLLEKNKTLTKAEIIVHDRDNDEGEKSYAVCPCNDPGDAISYHLELNRYGRGMVHAKETTKAEFADLLGRIEEEEPGRSNSKHAIQFGLLLERPCLWS